MSLKQLFTLEAQHAQAEVTRVTCPRCLNQTLKVRLYGHEKGIFECPACKDIKGMEQLPADNIQVVALITLDAINILQEAVTAIVPADVAAIRFV